MDIYTAPASLAGVPSLSLPCGFSQELPVGMQLIAPRWNDLKLLELAEKYQELTDWHKKKPNI